MLEDTKATLRRLHEEVQHYAGEFASKEPEEEQVDAVRNLVERSG